MPVLTRRRFLKTLTAAGLAHSAVLRWAVAKDLPPLRGIFYTDIHCMPGLADPATLERAAAFIRETPHDIIVAGGDAIHRGYVSTEAACMDRFAMYREFLGKFSSPVEHVVGNHDLAGARPDDGSPPSQDPWRLWREQLGHGSPNRSFLCGGYKFLTFDTLRIIPEASIYTADPQPGALEWLEREIAATPDDQPVILCVHIPFYSAFSMSKAAPGEQPPATLQVPGATSLIGRFRGKKLAAILQGHVHVNERLTLEGVPVLTGGAICGAWWKGPHLDTPPGLATFEIRDGQLIWRYHSLAA